ncbi:MAG: MBL fold metallo-hydrolase [Halioglobus sp.]|nr:MBL fold metallo-hydrolase [Halioglobus sp.]
MRLLTTLALSASLASTVFMGNVNAQETAATVSAQPLGGALHLLSGRGGNVVASIGLDGVLLIDNDYADLGPAYEEVLAGLTESGIAPGFVINTHWHGDHTGNNEYWGNRGAVLVAHRNVRTRLSTPQEIAALKRKVDPSPVIALPIVTFSESLALHFNDDDIEVQHYPAGHTDGDSVVFYSRQNVVHMGDLFFKDRFPFVDLSSGGSIDGYIANVEAVLARIDDGAVIVPGHGSLAGRDDLQRYLDMLRQTTSAVRAALQQGKSVEQVTAAGVGEQWDSWGAGFIDEASLIATIAADSL